MPATTRPRSGDHPERPDGPGVAFLLAQLGARAADRFAERIAALDLTPPQAGLLRVIAREPGSSQREVAAKLGLFPSRVVTFVDELEDRGLVGRQRSTTDRRQYALHLTKQGRALMQRLSTIARAHERDLCQPLDDNERVQLAALLKRVADQQGLTPGIHPGYQRP